MYEIDLIPTNYRDILRVRRWLKSFGLSAASLIILMALSKAVFAYLIHLQNDTINRLQQSKTSIVNNEKILDDLTRQKSSIEYKLDLLNKLQNGPATNALFTAIDNAMSKDIWFQELSYINKPESVPGKGDAAVNTGYFVVTPRSGGKSKGGKYSGNTLQTKIEIKGQALNHSALAAFVNRLNNEPIFNGVTIVSTQLRQYTRTEVVDFTLMAARQTLPAGSSP